MIIEILAEAASEERPVNPWGVGLLILGLIGSVAYLYVKRNRGGK